MSDLEFGPDSDEDLPEEVVADIEDGALPATAIRRWRNWTVEDVALRAGISVADVQAVENGSLGDHARLGKIAKALGVSVDLLIE